MTDPNRNALWARILVEELVRAGVRDFCVAPGSRSTPLVLAAHAAASGDRAGEDTVAAEESGEEARPVRVRVFLDERSAAFFALGLGRAGGVPAAVITTSGTAVANLLPAVVEAHQSEVPLLLLTADRPHHLRDADANQAIRQPGIFSGYPRESWDLPQPSVDAAALTHLRAVADRAVAAATGDPAGPVHVNVPFRKPLEPVEVEGDVPGELAESAPLAVKGRGADQRSRESRTGTADGATPGEDGADTGTPGEGGAGQGGTGVPLVRVGRRVATASADDLAWLRIRLAEARRPVLVVGPNPRPAGVGAAAVALAAAAGTPLLPDPLSGARTGPGHGATRIAAYDLFLRDEVAGEALEPDLVLRAGAAPTSAALNRWLGRAGHVPQVVVDGGVRWKDHLNVASRYIRADAATTFRSLAASLDPDTRPAAAWRDLWTAVDTAALTGALDAPGPLHEGHLASWVMAEVPSGSGLFVSSSMPIRDVDGFGGIRPEPVAIFGNRGASGIDGIVSSAAGMSAGLGCRMTLLVGDLAFLHDVNGMLALREPDVQVTVVVVNNDGGGIFHMLPIRDYDPPFTELFATPHGLDLSHAAALYGVEHRRVEALEDGREALRATLSSRGSAVLEFVTDRDGNRVGHESAVNAARAAARDALASHTEQRT